METPHIKSRRLPIAAVIGIISIAAVYGVFLAQKINLVTADLGRHIKNGEVMLTKHSLVATNLYSYTNPDYPLVNHHWLTGGIFFIIEKLGGFPLLSLVYIGISIATLIFFLSLAWRSSRFEIALLTSLITLPLLSTRVEVRPEVFSYLFCAIIFWVLWNYREHAFQYRALYVIPIIELLWVNIHIYFPFGILLVGLFLGEACIVFFFNRNPELRQKISAYALTLLAAVVATLINPWGIEGALYPFRIFGNYGYRLLENQTVWFIERLMIYPPALYFKIVFWLLVASWVWILIEWARGKTKPILVNFFLTVIFSVLGWTMVRNFALFGYFAIPIIAINLKTIRQNEVAKGHHYVALAAVGVMILVVLITINPRYWESRQFGIGLQNKVNGAIDFFRQEHLLGPIMNDYDNGGYLIYHLYPQEKVFVDNRPEAYPASFFEKQYIPMQENEEQWRIAENQYHFNVIFFNRNDLTPWAQSFLIRRVTDQDWAVVYLDAYSIVMLKRQEENQSTIARYEIPKNMFRVTPQ